LGPDDELLTCISYVEKLKADYYTKYHLSPKYIKLPMRFYLDFQAQRKTLLINDKDLWDGHGTETLCKLIICETPSIYQIDEIEVF